MRKILKILMSFLLLFLLSGCSIKIPFDKFILENEKKEAVGEIISIKGIDINKENKDLSIIESGQYFKEEFQKLMTDKKRYIEYLEDNDINTFFSYDLFSKECINALKNKEKENVLVDILKDIYTKENNRVYSVYLNSIGKKIIKNNIYNYLTLEFNVIEDKLGFDIYTIEILYDNEDKVTDIELVSKKIDANNTNAEITKESVINNNKNNEFINKFNELKDKISSKDFYKRIIEDNLDYNSNEFKGFVEEIFNNKDLEGIYRFFKAGKGEFKSVSFIQYSHTDINAEAYSEYISAVPYEDNIDFFKIKYDRLSNKILDIEFLKTLPNKEYIENGF